ncbi:hypothetical protein OG612_45310 (plasmid) [Streptomyces sp. NBC_01527]|uniref:hypothetical protein n=1 Tax=Streptomyces sp. NBC_01527 TaxID=2903894 RepID=UPI00386BE6E2
MQELLYERHGPLVLSATRELDDLKEALGYAALDWSREDLIDLASVTLAASNLTAPEKVRRAGWSYLDQLARHHQARSLGDSQAPDLDLSAFGDPQGILQRAMAATSLAEQAGLSVNVLRARLDNLRKCVLDRRSLGLEAGTLVTARTVELAAASSRVLRVTAEPMAVYRLSRPAHRRIGDLAQAIDLATSTATGQPKSWSVHTVNITGVAGLAYEQMRVALSDRHHEADERRRHERRGRAADESTAIAVHAEHEVYL